MKKLSSPVESHRQVLPEQDVNLSMIYLDDIRITSSGQPLQAESVADTTDAVPPVTQVALGSALEAARLGWMVGTPDGIAGLAAGHIGVAAGFPAQESWDAGEAGNAGGREGSFDNQGLFADFIEAGFLPISLHESTGNSGVGSLGSGFTHGTFVADQVGSDGHPSLPASGHTIESQDDSILLQGQHTVVEVIVDEHGTFKPNIGECGPR